MRISDWSSDVCSSDLVQTADVFSSPDLTRNTACVKISVFADWQKINAPNNGFYKNGLFGSNDLEPVVFAKHPVVEQAVKCLSEQIGRASCRERVCQYV